MTPSSPCATVRGSGPLCSAVPMRRHGLVLLCTLALAALAATVAATTARAHSTPQIRAEQEHERAVLAEVNQIGNQLQVAEDRAWSAQQRLNLVKQSLQVNEYRLHVARGDLHRSQKRLESRLYSLYVNPRPSAVEVMAGAHSLSQIIDREESAQALSNQDTALGAGAVRFEHAVQARERQLKSLEAKRAAAARELEAEKQAKASELGREKRLLASIHTTIANLQAQEAGARAGGEDRSRGTAPRGRGSARQGGARRGGQGAQAPPPPRRRRRRSSRRPSACRSATEARAIRRRPRSRSTISASRTSGAARARAASTAQAS